MKPLAGETGSSFHNKINIISTSGNHISKSGAPLNEITIKSNSRLESVTEDDQKMTTKFGDSILVSKVKHLIKLSDSQSKSGIHKRSAQQPIRIELKADGGMRDSALQFCSGDSLRFKVNMLQDQNLQHDGNLVEVDFVQSFQCKTLDQNACQCRRITKVLKRTAVTELDWQKGIHISGQQFALAWIPYKVPQMADEDNAENERKLLDETNGGCLSEEKLDNKFKVSDFQYELQVRFYVEISNPECVGEQRHHVLAACSCFPFRLMAGTNDEEKHTPCQMIPSEDDLEMEKIAEKCCGGMPIIKKSLSAIEFDVWTE